MTDDERAARMTPTPDLVRGCDSPDGVRILADWLDEHGGDGEGFRVPQPDVAEQPTPGRGGGFDYFYCGDGFGFGDGHEFGDGVGYACDYGTGGGDGSGHGDAGFGTPDGDGGPDWLV